MVLEILIPKEIKVSKDRNEKAEGFLLRALDRLYKTFNEKKVLGDEANNKAKEEVNGLYRKLPNQEQKDIISHFLNSEENPATQEVMESLKKSFPQERGIVDQMHTMTQQLNLTTSRFSMIKSPSQAQGTSDFVERREKAVAEAMETIVSAASRAVATEMQKMEIQSTTNSPTSNDTQSSPPEQSGRSRRGSIASKGDSSSKSASLVPDDTSLLGGVENESMTNGDHSMIPNVESGKTTTSSQSEPEITIDYEELDKEKKERIGSWIDDSNPILGIDQAAIENAINQIEQSKKGLKSPITTGDEIPISHDRDDASSQASTEDQPNLDLQKADKIQEVAKNRPEEIAPEIQKQIEADLKKINQQNQGSYDYSESNADSYLTTIAIVITCFVISPPLGLVALSVAGGVLAKYLDNKEEGKISGQYSPIIQDIMNEARNQNIPQNHINAVTKEKVEAVKGQLESREKESALLTKEDPMQQAMRDAIGDKSIKKALNREGNGQESDSSEITPHTSKKEGRTL